MVMTLGAVGMITEAVETAMITKEMVATAGIAATEDVDGDLRKINQASAVTDISYAKGLLLTEMYARLYCC